MAAQVPVLLTWDVDPSVFAPDHRSQILQNVLDFCQSLEIASTFFFVAQEAKWYPEQIAQMISFGHEIGSHGLTHGGEEEYDRMSEAMQRSYIEQATRLLEEQVGMPITAFRGPRVKISSVTLKLLAEYGYLTDSSVCPQRLDFVSSNLINPGWLVAPRSTYYPHEKNAFKRGALDILEVPVSALVLPFISTSLYIVRLTIMKMLFRLLYAESRRTSKPIVYLAHPDEFGLQTFPLFKWSDLSPRNIRIHGLKIRRHLNESNPEVRQRLNRELFSYIATFPGIKFMTMREYALQFNKAIVTTSGH